MTYVKTFDSNGEWTGYTSMPHKMRLLDNDAEINVETLDFGRKVELYVWPGGEQYNATLILTIDEAKELLRRLKIAVGE
jgi:hypothetical protein